MSPDHPLTARVEVNRLWQQCLRHRSGQNGGGFRHPGRAAEPSRLLDWLAVQFQRGRLGHQEDDEALRDVGDLSAIVASRRRTRWRKIPPIACCRADRVSAWMPRCCAIRRCSSAACWWKSGRPECQAAAAVGGLWEAVGYPTSNTAEFARRHGPRESASPQPVHLLETHVAAAADDHLRRPLARIVHRPPRTHQHAVASLLLLNEPQIRGRPNPGRTTREGRRRRPKLASPLFKPALGRTRMHGNCSCYWTYRPPGDLSERRGERQEADRRRRNETGRFAQCE